MARPIIIKKIKKVSGGGHHGGAWKVAYADFVTAMMAFFLLMWLLNATTEDQRKGIADYFDPKVPISRVSAGGMGMFNGDSVFSQQTLARSGLGGAGRKAAAGRDQQEKHEVATNENAWKKGSVPTEKVGNTLSKNTDSNGDSTLMDAQSLLEAAQNEIQRRLEKVSSGLMKHLNFKMTDEGLKIEIMDQDGVPLFSSGSSMPTEQMQDILGVLGSVLHEIENPIAITGHTDAKPFKGRRNYTNWELSADRANAARRIFENVGIDLRRFKKIEGKADMDPIKDIPSDDLRNRRIGVTILRE